MYYILLRDHDCNRGLGGKIGEAPFEARRMVSLFPPSGPKRGVLEPRRVMSKRLDECSDQNVPYLSVCTPGESTTVTRFSGVVVASGPEDFTAE